MGSSDRPFGPRFDQLDESDTDAMLGYLDDVADIAVVRGEKDAATATLELQPGQRVLEVGCGTGVDLPALATAVGPEGVVVGCDPSRAALAAAASRVPGVELVEAGAEALPFGDASFDACRIDRTLQHVPDPEAALRELARVVRPGGRLVVLEIATALEAGGTDGALTESIAQRIWPPGDQAWVGFLLPLLLRRTGWDHLALQQTSSASGDLADADAILRLRPAVAEAIAEGVLDEAAATAWRAGLERSARDGTLTLHVHCFRMAAVRS